MKVFVLGANGKEVEMESKKPDKAEAKNEPASDRRNPKLKPGDGFTATHFFGRPVEAFQEVAGSGAYKKEVK